MSWFEWGAASHQQRQGGAGQAGRSVVRTGRLGAVRWEARLTALPVSYGLNPSTLLKGSGRVARLVLYQSIGQAEVPHKLAVYDRGWHFGRKRNLAVIRRVMSELDR